MVLPLIPLVAIGVGVMTGGSGAVLGGKGALEIKKANDRIKAAGAEYEARKQESDDFVDRVNARLVDLGNEQQQALEDVVVRMQDFLVRNQKKVQGAQRELLDGIAWAGVGQVSAASGVDADPLSWARGVIGATAVGFGTGSATTAAVGALGAASTGTSISALSGAAATNATMAWLGGGSLASGGGGIAAGSMALNAVVAGPALLVAGMVVKGQGTKAKTQAAAAQAQIAIALAELDAFETKMRGLNTRCAEVSETLAEVTRRAVDRLELLESEEFDPAVHTERFQQAMVMTKAVAELVSVSVLGDDASVNPASADIVLRYRGFVAPERAEAGAATTATATATPMAAAATTSTDIAILEAEVTE